MPSDDITRLYDFTPATTIVSDQIDQELNQMVTTLNNKCGRSVDNTLSGNNTHSGTNTFSGTVSFSTVIPTLPASTPTMSNEAASKAYVDSRTYPTGALVSYVGTTAPTGWILCDGKTIGDASSSGTGRANADTTDLFTLLWNSMADAQAAVSGGRGASAAADFASHKTIALPDLRGRIPLGKDNMGGSTASRVTSASTNGGNATTLGGVGGSETHALTSAQNGPHSHDLPVNGAGGGGLVLDTLSPSGFNGSYNGTTSTSGSGDPHSNTQPWIALNYIIKL